MKWFSRHLDENYPCRKLYPGCTKEQYIKLNDGQLWTLNFGSVTGRARGYANAEQVE